MQNVLKLDPTPTEEIGKLTLTIIEKKNKNILENVDKINNSVSTTKEDEIKSVVSEGLLFNNNIIN